MISLSCHTGPGWVSYVFSREQAQGSVNGFTLAGQSTGNCPSPCCVDIVKTEQEQPKLVCWFYFNTNQRCQVCDPLFTDRSFLTLLFSAPFICRMRKLKWGPHWQARQNHKGFYASCKSYYHRLCLNCFRVRTRVVKREILIRYQPSRIFHAGQ